MVQGKVTLFSCSALYTERDAQAMRVFNVWLSAAGILFATSTILLGEKFVAPGPLAWLLIAGTIFAFAGTIVSYVRFLRGADELLRKIQIEGLASGFGAGILFMIGWRLLERVGAPKLDVDDPSLVMIASWAIGQWIALRHYTGGVEVEA